VHTANRPSPARRTPLVLVALIAAVSLVGGCGSPAPSVTPSARPSLPPLPETPFPTGALDPALGWQRIDLSAAAAPNRISTIIVANGGFVAAGVHGEGADRPLVLSSPDGLTWRSEPIAPSPASPSQLVVADGRVIAVGAGATSRCAHPFAINSWARSADGRWTEAPWNEAFCAGLNEAHLLAWRGEAWLVGSGSGDQPFDWSSADGLHWVAKGTVGGILPTAAVVDGDSLLAFGQDAAGAVAARRSSDGVRWAVVSMAPVASRTIPAAFVGNGRLQAFLDDGGRMDVLTREPAGAVSIVRTDGMDVLGDTGTFVEIGDRLVRLAQDSDQLPVGWSSADGITWSAIQLPTDSGPGTTFTGVAVLDGTAILVGQTVSADGSSSIGAVWAGSESLLGS